MLRWTVSAFLTSNRTRIGNTHCIPRASVRCYRLRREQPHGGIMRGSMIVAFLFCIVGCATTPPTTAEDQKWFREAFAANAPKCVDRTQTELKLSEDAAVKFCECQINVFATSFSRTEMDIVYKMTFGPPPSDAEAMSALNALQRVIPVRQRTCGF